MTLALALAVRRSMKALLRIPLAVKAEAIEKQALNSPCRMLGDLCKVGLGDFKFESTSKTVCHATINIRGLCTNVELKRKQFKEAGTKLENDKRKMLKGKRTVINWIKHFRWKKKKEYEQMSLEEKVIYKLKKAQRKEARLVAALQKLEPKHSSDTTHDPEILTPEEHFYYLKMGHKCKNYVPIGRRGIFGGVILNMHLHWKKHQAVKVIVKTFTPDEVCKIAAELARLTGGIVLDIHEGNTIIMYRGRNYSQPPTEIMTPRITLSKNKALTKSKYKDALQAVRIFIPRLENELEMLRQRVKGGGQESQKNGEQILNNQRGVIEHVAERAVTFTGHFSECNEDVDEHARETKDLSDHCGSETDHVSGTDFDVASDSEALSDLFETDCEMDTDSCSEPEDSLYLDNIDTPQVDAGKTLVDFTKDKAKTSEESKKVDGLGDDSYHPELDEVDKLFLRVSTLLKKKK
ncbi:uncharacterized CRM domain-containing protein At3g25440, chloroplastic isoform X2 [Cryptomeria japonica]|uniref:uncharacterized CRM domain-containing protein At3g25440, chloroplastic isoform X2 n=1 Tax=Cryptomeria japonica TaxID=3369 RepID=UPI0025ACD92F|nr:uncharacterized CRM domain-containing protein At3g25440, chloroplastic isoform X2 [Cryptomeria japonica]